MIHIMIHIKRALMLMVVTSAAMVLNIPCRTLAQQQHQASLTLQQRLDEFNKAAEKYRYTSSDSSLWYAEQALQLAEQLHNTRGKSYALYHRSYALYSQGKYDLALTTLYQTLPLFEELADSNGIGRTLNDIGNIYKRQQRYQEALDYYYKSFAVFEAIGHKEGMALELCNIGVTQAMAGKHEESARQSRRGLALAEEIGYEYGVVFASTNIGSYYVQRGFDDSALVYYQRALVLAEKLHNEKYNGQLHYFLGALFARKRQFDKAVEYTRKGLQIAEQSKFAERVKEAYLTFVEVYAAKGDFANALSYHRRYAALRDSLFSADVRRNIDELQKRIATEQKDKQIQLLQKEQELQSVIRNSLIGGIVFLVLVAVLLTNRYRIKRTSEQRLQQSHVQLLEANKAIQHHAEVVEEQARHISEVNEQLNALNATLGAQNRQLLELNTEKTAFLGIVAHDLKNPVNVICNLAEMMLKNEQEISINQRHEFLRIIVNSSERMFELLRNLLQINALEERATILQPTLVNVAMIAQFITADYRMRAEQKSITLHFDFEGTGQAFADEHAVKQVLDNIISNAVKYSPPNKHIWVTVRDVHDHNRGYVRISVRDEGPGLSEEDKTRLFGKFARLSAQPTGGEHSTGLGLSIVKRFVEDMKGRVWCESTLGKGATFIVELPQQEYPS